jgi:hypothetical protein
MRSEGEGGQRPVRIGGVSVSRTRNLSANPRRRKVLGRTDSFTPGKVARLVGVLRERNAEVDGHVVGAFAADNVDLGFVDLLRELQIEQ